MAGSVAIAAKTIDEALAQVDAVHAQGADLVKLMITGGVMDATERGMPGEVKMPAEMVRAVCERAHALGDLRAGKALLGELRRRDDQKALAGAQILRIDHKDVRILLRRGAGILIAAGEIRADGDLHHRVILVRVAREHLAVLVLADRRRAAKVSAAVHVGKNVGGRDVHTIVEVLAVLDDAQRRDGNIIALEQRGRQVARAVGNDLHSHRSFLPS